MGKMELLEKILRSFTSLRLLPILWDLRRNQRRTRARPGDGSSEQKEYFSNGFLSLPLGSKPKHRELISLLCEIREGRLPGRASWEEKQPKYFILRDLPDSLDRLILDFIEESRLHERIRLLSGRAVVLADYAIVEHRTGIQLNTPWHRDTHFLDKLPAGPVPASIKGYLYPAFEDRPLPRIQFCPGSHRFDLNSKDLDHLVTTLGKKRTLHSSDQDFALFDTLTLHRVVPEPKGESSLRLSFNFYVDSPEQLERYARARELQDLYRDRFYGQRASLVSS
jgi:hypothetical protein